MDLEAFRRGEGSGDVAPTYESGSPQVSGEGSSLSPSLVPSRIGREPHHRHERLPGDGRGGPFRFEALSIQPAAS